MHVSRVARKSRRREKFELGEIGGYGLEERREEERAVLIGKRRGDECIIYKLVSWLVYKG